MVLMCSNWEVTVFTQRNFDDVIKHGGVWKLTKLKSSMQFT